MDEKESLIPPGPYTVRGSEIVALKPGENPSFDREWFSARIQPGLGFSYEQVRALVELFAAAPETAAERDRLRVENAEMVKALKKAAAVLSAEDMSKSWLISALEAIRAALAGTPSPRPDVGQVNTKLLEGLQDIANAKRFNRDHFEGDKDFADWVQNRARHALAKAGEATP